MILYPLNLLLQGHWDMRQNRLIFMLLLVALELFISIEYMRYGKNAKFGYFQSKYLVFDVLLREG